MPSKLYYNTVDPLLLSILKRLMLAKEFEAFRLVGGTALSLYRGHRKSIDIDLFTDAVYGSIDFDAIDSFLRKTYPYVETNEYDVIGFGKSYFIGKNEKESVKLDVFYTDKFIEPLVVIDTIKLATLNEIIAMKLDVVSRGGRKKDFWDLHELIDNYTAKEMFSLHKKRYPYSHDPNLLKRNFQSFKNADDDFDPICLKGKYWELIKIDTIEFISKMH
jgi:hypothetical protein